MGKKAEQELHSFLVNCFGSEESFKDACKEENLCLFDEMLSPESTMPDKVIQALEKRTNRVKKDLLEYFANIERKLY